METILVEELDLLKDIKIFEYLLKNVNLVLNHFNIPDGEVPRQFLLRMNNALLDVSTTDVAVKKERFYTTKPMYVTREKNV